MYPWQKSAVIEILDNCLVDNRNLGAVASDYFKSHKKLGKRDRQNILENAYLIARNALFSKDSWDEILEGKLDVESFELNSAYSSEFLDHIEECAKETQLNALNDPKSAFIRVDLSDLASAKTFISGNEFSSDCEFVSTYTVKVQGKGLRYLNREKENLSFKFEFQDFGSQSIIDSALSLTTSNVHHALDYCAGNGGKTLQLVDRFNLESCHSCDIHSWKLENLKYRARYHDVSSRIETFVLPSEEQKLRKEYDFVLLDVPCSGTGTWGREPIQRAFWSVEKQLELESIQSSILIEGSKKVKPKGYLCYATCSILDTENIDQVNRFLSQNHDFDLVKSEVINPDNGHDGFFWALLKRS